MSTSEQNRPGARRLWERNAAHERVGVDVAGPDGTVVIQGETVPVPAESSPTIPTGRQCWTLIP